MQITSRKIGALICVIGLAACGGPNPSGPGRDVGNAAINAIIHNTQIIPVQGTYALGVTQARDAQLYVPAGAACPVPAVVMLHGAGGTAAEIATVVNEAAALGIAVIVPYSRQTTWEIANQSFGEDVRNIDKAIQAADARLCLDSTRIALAGFSDGASFALSLGIANGQLFSHVIAFSPGFLIDTGHRGKAGFYVAHGSNDTVLSFDYTQQQIVPYLSKYFTVQFAPFTGGHTVSAQEAHDAFVWFAQ